MTDEFDGIEIAVLIPCFNEASSVGKVVSDFRATLPSATVYVYDNNSTDDTVPCAEAAGAVVRSEPMQGKGYVMRRMFADINADVYVIVDGDDTYDSFAVRAMVRKLIGSRLDFVNGQRVSSGPRSYRVGHRLGNRFLTNAVAFVFGHRIDDMLSGLKVLSKRFVKSFPCLATGFEIETEITVHALELVMPIAELPVSYRERQVGSLSKLNTVRDGIRIGWLILRLLRAERPMVFFGSAFGLMAATSTRLGWQLFVEFKATGQVRIPTAVLSVGMMLSAFLSASCGLILETVTLGRREGKRMVYLSMTPLDPSTSTDSLVGIDSPLVYPEADPANGVGVSGRGVPNHP